jgi:hypothetical protein
MTDDRVVAALKPAALGDLPEDDMDARIAAIVASPRPARSTRTPRVPRVPLLLVAAGAVAAAAITVVSTRDAGHRVDPVPLVPLAPSKVHAAALSFTQQGRYLTVKVKDPIADPARYKKEFAAHGLHVDLTLAPTSPKKAGAVIFLEDDGNGQVKTILAKGRCGTVTCGVGIKIPLRYKGYVHVVFGRSALPGEHYNTGPGDVPGEGVGLSDVRGRTVADVLAEARRRHIGNIGYRYQPTSRDEQGDKQPYPMGVPADKVKGDWRVYDAVAGSGGQVLLFVHPAG